jgi:photosystem II stability/assembly factor-like uncharacterized protein
MSAWCGWRRKQFRQESSMSVKTFLATTGHGLASATCGKDDAWSVEVMLAGQDVRCLAADPLHPEIIYAGTQGRGVLRSNDGGKTWRSVGLAGQSVKSLAASRTQPGTAWRKMDSNTHS